MEQKNKNFGIKSLQESVLRDLKGDSFCEDASKCKHGYCRKYHWALERAAHYAEHLGTTPEAVLEAWEADRTYWYMNYYQDCKQPLIEGDNVRVFDTPDDFHASILVNEFRCPRCGKVSTDEQECSQEDCDWKSYGLLRTLGKGVTVLTKNPILKAHMFMPIAWEKQ